MPRRLQTNWISAYAEAMVPCTESPDAFVVWCAISVISAVLKKQVWLPRGMYTIYPNQYIILVAPPGVGKGEAIHPAHAFVKQYKPSLSNYLSDRITAPKIIEKLAQGFPTSTIIGGQIISTTESTVVLQSAELSTLLGSSDWMTTFLCDAWDRNEFDYDTKNKGTSIIKNMCVSLIGACVPDFIRKINGKQSSTEMVNGGFTARALFVFASEPSKQLPWPMPLDRTTDGPKKISDLRHDLEEIAKLNGEFSFTQEAINIWTPWYGKVKKVSDHDSDAIRNFKARQHIHVLKVAMCFSAANSDSLVIDKWALTTAIALVNNILATLDVTFRGVGESSLAEATAKVQTYIEKKGICTRSELVRDNHRHVTQEDLDRILMTLTTIGLIRTFTQGGKLYYEYLTTTQNP